MKRILSLAICLMLILSASYAFAASIPTIDNKENCVADMADVISQETEDYLSQLNARLEEETGASIVIATVDFTGSMSVSEYAYEAFNKWGIGDKDKDNGLLLLMAIGQEDYFAAHGTGLEKALTAAELDQLLWDYLEEDFAAERYDEGAKSFYLAAYEWFSDYYDVNLSTGDTADVNTGNDTQKKEEENQYEEKEVEPGIMGKILMWIALIIIVIILVSAFTDKGGPVRKTKTYRPRVHQRRGPHTSTYRRVSPTVTKPKRTVTRTSRSSSHSGNTTSRNTVSRSTSSRPSASKSTTSRSSSTTRSSSSSRSSAPKSGGFGGGSSRGGGAGRRK